MSSGTWINNFVLGHRMGLFPLNFNSLMLLKVKANIKNNLKRSNVVQLILQPFAAWKEGFVAEANVADKNWAHFHIFKKAAFGHTTTVGVAESASS
jgi:hypothetical protein